MNSRTRKPNLLIALFCAGSLFAQQNLVTNPGFEDLSATVSNWNQLSHANGWSNANAGSVDILAKTAGAGNVGIPVNELGTVEPFDGDHCAGFVAWKDDMRPNFKKLWKGKTVKPHRPAWNKYSEYLQGQLSQPLTADANYKVSFKVSLGDNSDRAVSGLGAMFSSEPVAENHRRFLDGTPDVWTTEVIKDKEGWVEVKGEFTAAGGEQYIIIGAYSGEYMTKENIVSGPDNQRAYYYVDGISVTEFPKEDADKDGVADIEDSCPNTPGLKEMNGCPDSDGDGIADNADKCPNKPAPGTATGCPDTDGDGIADNEDKCPNVAGMADNAGCPKIKEETKRLFQQALSGVKFESGKATLKSSSYSILNNVVKVMKDNPSYDLEIHGHTDSQGDNNKNFTLSQNRANSVKRYLEGKGVDASRLKASGHGEDNPIADNATSAGRAKNRRVEFKVAFWR